jgi:hypothetical protein
MSDALAPLHTTLVDWDGLSQAEIERLSSRDGAAGTVPLLLLIDNEGLRVVSPFGREMTAQLLVGAGVELRKGGLN